MFTGIVREIGAVRRIDSRGEGTRLEIAAELAAELREGDSVSVDGACLTATSLLAGAFTADVMNQTLDLSSLGELAEGDAVNLEPALRAGEPLGGHIVQGHVDCTGSLRSTVEDGFARRLRIAVPQGYRRYLVEHGSVTVAGVSLTVTALTGDGFEVALVPETLERTTLGAAAEDRTLNIEVDVIARYVERLLGSHRKEPDLDG